MSQTPSLYECFTWIQELCSNVLSTTNNNNTQYEEDPLVIIRSTRIFINALNAPSSIIQAFLSQLDQLNDLVEKTNDLGTVAKEIQSICQACTPWLDPISYVICKPLEGSTTSIYHIESPKIVPHISASDYKRMLPDTFNYEASWFRHYFVGNPYITLIGPLNDTKSSSFYSDDCWDNNELYINNINNNNNAPYATITVVQENNKAYTMEKKLQNQDNNNTTTNTISSPFLHKKLSKHKSVTKSSESSLINHIYSSSSTSSSASTTSSSSYSPKSPASSILATNDLQDTHYRVIIRNNKETTCHLLPSSLVRDTIISLDSMGQCERLESSFSSKINQQHHQPSQQQQQQKQKRRPLRSISSAIINHATGSSSNINVSSSSKQQQLHYHHHYHINHQEQSYSLIKLLHAAVLTIYPNLDLRPFNTLSAEDTILAGLEKDLLHYDEIGIPKNYKFGILCVKDNQTTEEEWFSNTGLSKELEYFLNLIGRQVTLKNYNGYAAGLDIKCGESGEYSYVTSWRDNEIMFHVGPLMPLNIQDKQQVHRKRYIGNDIVCIIFMETDQQNIFDPGVIRSQFLHAFIVVHPEIVEEKQAWRVEVIYNKNMKEFGPSIPSPPLFFSEENLREFLILKLVSAEMSALQSDKFSIPNTKARQGILKTLLENGLAATTTTINRSQTSSPINSFLRSKSGNNNNNNENKLKGGNHYHQRPMSAGPAAERQHQSSRASIQSLRGAPDSPSPPPPPLILPPQITSSISISSSPSSSTHSSSIFLSRSLTPDQTLTTTTTATSSTSNSPSSFFPNPSRSSMLRDIKSFTKRRHSTTSANNNNNNSNNNNKNKSRTTTPSSIDRSFHTESPYPMCNSPISSSRLTMMESPISWMTDKENNENNNNHSIEDLQQGQERRLRRETSISSFSSSTSSLNLGMTNCSSSINNNNHHYLSSSSSISLNSNHNYNLSSSPSPSETGNSSIRSRAQQLMSTVILGRRKQSISRHFDNNNNNNNQHKNNNNNNDNDTNNSNDGVSKLSRISKSKSILS